MKTLKINGVSVSVSDKEYIKYIKEVNEMNKSKKQTKAKSSTLSIPAEPKSKSVSVTYSDYVTRALKAGMELLYISDFVSVVAKGDVVVAEITAPIKKVYCGIKMSIKDFGGKWCGDHDKKVFTYKFENREQGMEFVKAQKARG